MLKRFAAKFEHMAAERPVFLAFLVFLTATAVVIPISLPFYLNNTYEFLTNVVAEAHGTVFDLLIIGWFLLWINRLAERRVRNNRYREEIDDYLGWKSQEATHRIAGNIRRLNRNGVKEKMRLTEAHLYGANLAGASLEEADLWGANLEGAILRDAVLVSANLAGANLEGADLERADLRGADLRGAALKEADLERANLVGTDLRAVSLTSADLQYADLERASLERANLTGANLRGANLSHADLRGATLEGANLRGARLEGANLIEVELKGADLLGADLTDAHLPEGNDLFSVFEKAKTLFGASFPPEVEKQLQEAYPRLFQMAYQPGPAYQSAGDGAGPALEQPEDRPFASRGVELS